MMTTQLSSKTFWQHIIASILALLFSYAAFSKLANVSEFEWQMLNQPLPRNVGRILVWLIPSSEIIIVWLLIIPGLRHFGLMASFLMMTMFTVYVGAISFHFFNRIPCSCGGVLSAMSWNVHLVFNLAITGLCLLGVRLRRDQAY